MRIVLASSEAVPFSKTGGLADVASALAGGLAEAGHSVWLFVPHYQQPGTSAAANGVPIEQTDLSYEIPIASRKIRGGLSRTRLPGSAVTVFLIDQPAYFHRGGLYQDKQGDYRDNCERFVFFSRAVLEVARRLRLRPDIIHANDWQTGLIPAYVAVECREAEDPELQHAASVFTIHNMAFQGVFWHWDVMLTGLDWKYFNWTQMEFYNQLNLLKTGIAFADQVTTVSPTYAREIRTPEFGNGLDATLRDRRDALTGILNGVDLRIWNPQTDAAIAQSYSVTDVVAGKQACKRQLQAEVGLPTRDEPPLLGMISRLTDQKGLDLIAGTADEILSHDVQLVFLGAGDPKHESWLAELSKKFPEKVAAKIGFDDGLAHRIEAGSDLFLMPSRFEPCGLNQMYSLIYGTPPIVRAVGGLADSVVDASADNLANGTATGFSFTEYSSAALAATVRRAIALYQDKPEWLRLLRAGMNQDWSWRRSTAEYVRVYQRAIAASMPVIVPAEEESITA